MYVPPESLEPGSEIRDVRLIKKNNQVRQKLPFYSISLLLTVRLTVMVDHTVFYNFPFQHFDLFPRSKSLSPLILGVLANVNNYPVMIVCICICITLSLSDSSSVAPATIGATIIHAGILYYTRAFYIQMRFLKVTFVFI